jgi:hypothetical protein
MKTLSNSLIGLIALTTVPLLFSCNPESLSTFSTLYPHNNSSTQSHSSAQDREKIIGNNDLTPVSENGENLPEALRPIIAAIGQVSVGCTATHIGKGLVLTAGHCILTSPRSGPKYCRGVAVVWGNYPGSTGQTVSKCREVVFRNYNSASDIALIRVENPPKAFIPLDLKTGSSSLSLPRSNITLLSFPRMRPLEWSQECEMSEYKEKKFLHSCDTEPGSSGAALIDTTTLKVIGVHGGASDELNYGSFLNDLQSHWKEI